MEYVTHRIQLRNLQIYTIYVNITVHHYNTEVKIMALSPRRKLMTIAAFMQLIQGKEDHHFIKDVLKDNHTGVEYAVDESLDINGIEAYLKSAECYIDEFNSRLTATGIIFNSFGKNNIEYKPKGTNGFNAIITIPVTFEDVKSRHLGSIIETFLKGRTLDKNTRYMVTQRFKPNEYIISISCDDIDKLQKSRSYIYCLMLLILHIVWKHMW